MKKLNSHARTTEVDDVSDRLIAVYDAHPALAADPFLAATFGEIRTQSHGITEAIKRDRALSELDSADALRDDRVRDLRDIIRGYRALPLPAQSKAAVALWIIFAKYGMKMTRENYASESSLIESLLLDLSTAEAQLHIDALAGMPEAIAALRSAQTDFTAKRIAYETHLAHGAEGLNASEIRKTLLELINGRLLTYIDTMVMVDRAKYASFAAIVEKVIDDTNAVIARRTGKTPEAS